MQSFPDAISAACHGILLPKADPFSKFDISLNFDDLLQVRGRFQDDANILPHWEYLLCT